MEGLPAMPLQSTKIFLRTPTIHSRLEVEGLLVVWPSNLGNDRTAETKALRGRLNKREETLDE